jgi:hypothetical protein
VQDELSSLDLRRTDIKDCGKPDMWRCYVEKEVNSAFLESCTGAAGAFQEATWKRLKQFILSLR